MTADNLLVRAEGLPSIPCGSHGRGSTSSWRRRSHRSVHPAPLTPNAAMRHDAHRLLDLPGLVNSHTHGHANLMKGVAERWTLEASLTNGPWLAGARDPKRCISRRSSAPSTCCRRAALPVRSRLQFPRHPPGWFRRRRASLRGCRHACGAGADGCRQVVVSSIPGLARRAAGGFPRRRRQVRTWPAASDHRRGRRLPPTRRNS